ncbi:MAG: bifunctional 3-(3-hydroxy-phenyl)propionate/3-hydroxycinnamic acid hydroxylase [Solirubrobacterales bacterium]|nr:bifunctional 3-(3-hydroxy-phenyl)propionate/3-hydroxycinnamic acid hydroxylase [Solirubrobacterales bacterium]
MASSIRPAEPRDVVIVGYGPTGMMLGLLLGQRGHRVTIVEAHRGLYNQPRAATFDDEVMRTFQKLGLASAVAEGTMRQLNYEWQNADGQLLIEHTFDQRGRAGWAEWYMMYQPHLEDVLDAACRGLANVEILRGHRVTEVTDCADVASVVAVSADGDATVVPGRYVVGCDGGNSFVRPALGIELDDYGFEAPWLVTDFRIRRPLGLPAALQVCDPEQPTAIIRIGPNHQRFSFMLHDGETVEHATDPDNVWRRVARWVGPDDVEMQRVAHYTFCSLIAKTWSRGRVLLAGDAAHQMPPFLGQGMCSGIRDAHNLAWKLDLILSGTADASLLDTYQPERDPHVRAITEMAIALGKIQTLRDPEAVRERDERWLALRAQHAEPERLRFPGLTGGLVAAAAQPEDAETGAGELFIQGLVEVAGRRGLFDDRIGQGFTLISRATDPLATLDAEQARRWSRIGGRMAWFASDGAITETAGDGATRFVDLDGDYARWFDAHGCAAVVVRPDWYVYGIAHDASALSRLLSRLDTALG